MYMTAVEELLLFSALDDEALREKFHGLSPEAFQATINDLLTSELDSFLIQKNGFHDLVLKPALHTTHNQAIL